MEELKIVELKHKIVIAAAFGPSRKKWRILSIERDLRWQLAVDEDPREYTEDECRVQVDLMVSQGGGTIKKPLVAFGILGLIRLVESHHLLVIERRLVVIISVTCI